MDVLFEWIKIGGALAGIAALGWRIWDEVGTYLRISLKVEAPKSRWASALTSVENKGNRAKKLSYAFLLVGPESESALETAKSIAKGVDFHGKLAFTNDLELFRVEFPTYVEGRALIPLSFYFSENVRISDETLTYRAQIDAHKLNYSEPYAVRFFVFCEGRLHRSTHDSFINVALPETEDLLRN